MKNAPPIKNIYRCYERITTMDRPLRFGVATLQNLPLSRLVEDWKLAETLGFDSAWVTDHFVNPQYQ